MANLNHLVVHNAPKAFAQLAEAHNELVRLIATMEGALGIDIQVAHSPRSQVSMPPGVAKPKSKPRGKIMVSGVPTAWDGFVNGGSSSGGGGGNSNVGATIQAVGIAGFLYDVLQPVSPNSATNYPNILIAQNIVTPALVTSMTGQGIVAVGPGTVALLDVVAGNVIVTNGSNQVEMRTDQFTGTNGSRQALIGATSGLGLYTGSNSATIPMASITHDMAIKTMRVCVNNVSMNILVFASDPF